MRNWGSRLANRRLNLLVLVATRTIVATTLASIGVAALTLLLTISGVVLVTAASTVVLLALVKALVGCTLASHTGHELLNDVGDLVHVFGVDRALAIFLEMTLEVLLVFVVLGFKLTVLFYLVVVHVELFVVNHEVLLVLGCLGLVRGLVANEGVWALVVFCLENAAGLNFTKLTEDVSEVLFGLVAETFNIEVASLL